MITVKQFDNLAQKAHFAAGLSAVWGSQVILHNAWEGLAGILIFALLKEFVYDYLYETPEVRGSSVKDFAFYILGALIAILTIAGGVK